MPRYNPTLPANTRRQKYGIKELTEAGLFGCAIGDALTVVAEGGKLTLVRGWKLLKAFFAAFRRFGPAYDNIAQARHELADLDEAERDQWAKTMEQNVHLPAGVIKAFIEELANVVLDLAVVCVRICDLFARILAAAKTKDAEAHLTPEADAAFHADDEILDAAALGMLTGGERREPEL